MLFLFYKNSRLFIKHVDSLNNSKFDLFKCFQVETSDVIKKLLIHQIFGQKLYSSMEPID